MLCWSLSGSWREHEWEMTAASASREKRALGKTTTQLSVLLQSWQSRSCIDARCLALLFWPGLVTIPSLPDQIDDVTQPESGSQRKERNWEREVENSSPHTDVLFWTLLSPFVFNLLCSYFTLTGGDMCWTYDQPWGGKQEYVCGAMPPRRNGS